MENTIEDGQTDYSDSVDSHGKYIGFNTTTVLTEIHSARKLIRHYENDYKKDLAIHLYSAHLLHRINPSVPGAAWTMWPLKKNHLYDPRPEQIYTPEPDMMDDEEIITLDDVHPENPIDIAAKEYDANRFHYYLEKDAKKFIEKEVLSEGKEKIFDEGDDDIQDELKSESNDQSDNDSDDDETEKIDDNNDNNDGEVFKEDSEKEPLNITPVESLPHSVPSETLYFELDAAFKRAIVKTSSKHVHHRFRTQLSVDHTKAPDWLLNHMKGKIDTLIRKFERRGKVDNLFNTFRYQDILSEADASDAFKRKIKELFTTKADEFLKDFEKQVENHRLLESDTEAEETSGDIESNTDEEESKETAELEVNNSNDYNGSESESESEAEANRKRTRNNIADKSKARKIIRLKKESAEIILGDKYDTRQELDYYDYHHRFKLKSVTRKTYM